MAETYRDILTFDQLSHLWKEAGFRSNTKCPPYLGSLRVQFDDLSFQKDTQEITLGRCVVNFATKTIMDENQQEYTWTNRKCLNEFSNRSS